MKSSIRIGTRRSPLAMWQAEWVASRLQTAGHGCELVPMDTRGDRMLSVPIPEIGSKGVFTEELEKELETGNIDLAVHSAKDLPSALPPGFELIAFTLREQAHDVLVSYRELDLTGELLLGTSSIRRASLFRHYYPNFKTTPVRGNLHTRLMKLEKGTMDALALAKAGVHRLGLDKLIKYSFPLETLVPAVGQGSMAIEVSQNLDSDKKVKIRQALNHLDTEVCLLAERAFLYTIQGGCSIPAFAYAWLSNNMLTIRGGIVSLDGQQLVKLELTDTTDNPNVVGSKLGQEVLASGGSQILKEIKSQMRDTL